MYIPVDGPPPLHPDHFYSVLVLHTQFDEGHRNQDGSPTQPSHAMNTNTRLSGVAILFWEGKKDNLKFADNGQIGLFNSAADCS